jgi:hypothetical protein
MEIGEPWKREQRQDGGRDGRLAACSGEFLEPYTTKADDLGPDATCHQRS